MAVFAGNTALLDFCDEDVAGVERGQQLLSWILLPAHHHPESVWVDSQESLLHFLCIRRYRDIPCGAALLKDLHIVDCRIAVKIVLMAVEGLGELVQNWDREDRAGRGE